MSGYEQRWETVETETKETERRHKVNIKRQRLPHVRNYKKMNMTGM